VLPSFNPLSYLFAPVCPSKKVILCYLMKWQTIKMTYQLTFCLKKSVYLIKITLKKLDLKSVQNICNLCKPNCIDFNRNF